MTARKAFSPVRPKSVRAQITDHVRAQVTGGTLAPGDKLPSTQELARTWNTHVATVHAALTPLVKEGLISRTRKRGTIVERPEARLERVGVYLPSKLLSGGDGVFVRSVCVHLESVMRTRGGAVDMWVDPRPHSARATCWKELREAARRRAVHAVVAPRTDRRTHPWLSALPVPTAFISGDARPRCVSFDMRQFARAGVAELARAGCRSIGMISVLSHTRPDSVPGGTAMLRAFRERAADLGIETRPDWIKTPGRGQVAESDAEGFGYDSMRSVLGGRSRPRGLLVFTDVAARGALMAAAESGAAGAGELSLVLHRNAEVGLFCPYPASYLDVSASAVADALVDLLARQMRGEDAANVMMAYRVSRSRKGTRK